MRRIEATFDARHASNSRSHLGAEGRSGRAARMTVMSAPLAAVAEALYRKEVARARAMRPEDKLLEGPRLFERACRIMADGVRHRHTDLDEQAVHLKVAEQLSRLQVLDTP